MSGTGTTTGPRFARLGSRPFAFGGLLLGALLGFVAGSQPWWRARGQGVDVAFTGSDATGGLTAALAAVVLAGAVLALVLRAPGRRVLAVLLGLAGAGMLVVGLLRLRPGAADVVDRVRETTLLDAYRLDPTLWNLGYAVAGALVLLGALSVLVYAGRWPSRADRFQRPETGLLDTAGPATAAGATGTSALDQDPARWWRAQDAGQDPTAGSPPAEHPATEPGPRE